MATIKCTSFCMPSVKAPYKQYFKPCVRSDWSKKPGFLNPYAVADICFSVMARTIYSTPETLHGERPTIDEPCGRYLQNRNICRGIKMYLEPWQEQEGIEEGNCSTRSVPNLDSSGKRICKCNWKSLLADEYLKKVIVICLSTAFISRLNTLPEIDMCAAIAIGRYLNNLHRIAADHKIVNFRMNLATVWGPLYINVEPATDVKPPIIMTECEKFSASVEIFAKVLDAVPWESAAPLRNVSLPTISVPHMDSVYSTTNRIREACLMKLINKPSGCKGSLAEILQNEAMIACTKPENRKPEEEKIKMAKCCTELVSTDKFKLPCEKSC
ncbi:hypothetical protein ACTXT7_007969 [Hymenolepis weldensis]